MCVCWVKEGFESLLGHRGLWCTFPTPKQANGENTMMAKTKFWTEQGKLSGRKGVSVELRLWFCCVAFGSGFIG